LPETDLALLTDAARAAGEIALRFWRRSPEVWEKDAGAGPVSAADLAVNDMLAAKLGAARPAYGWLSEETPDSAARLAADRVFIVDPIDGTRAFIDGTPDFAHSIAVAERGVVSAAVVYLPAQNRLYSASIDGLAHLNGAPIRCSDQAGADDATVLTARATLAPEHWRCQTPPPVRRMFRSSLAWRLCLVAEGAFDAMLTLRPTWEWDVAAGVLIAARAGAIVTDRTGGRPTFNAQNPRVNGLVAAAPGAHRDLVGRLEPGPTPAASPGPGK